MKVFVKRKKTQEKDLAILRPILDDLHDRICAIQHEMAHRWTDYTTCMSKAQECTQQQIAQLQKQIGDLEQEKSNSKSFPAPIDRLPTELLAEIFGARNPVLRTAIMRVCRSWRATGTNLVTVHSTTVDITGANGTCGGKNQAGPAGCRGRLELEQSLVHAFYQSKGGLQMVGFGRDYDVAVEVVDCSGVPPATGNLPALSTPCGQRVVVCIALLMPRSVMNAWLEFLSIRKSSDKSYTEYSNRIESAFAKMERITPEGQTAAQRSEELSHFALLSSLPF